MEKIASDELILQFQNQFYKGALANNFEPIAESTERMLDDGIILKNEIKYDEEYPNSFADLYHCGNNTAPTLVYLHGGGWFMGSRTNGDPFASAGGGIAKQNMMMAKEGFNIISMDYCLAPDYRFPAQLKQINSGLSFFFNHADTYRINKKNFVILGGSAGAVLTGQLGLIYSLDSKYGKTIGVEPLIDSKCVRGIAIDGAPMNVKLFDQGVVMMVKSWYGTNDLSDELARTLHICEWVTCTYPKTFLTAGNEGCFMEHTKELGAALRKVGVEVDEFYPDVNVSKEGHGYMGNFENSAQAREGMKHMMDFIKKVTA